jgi:hypothetical protein
VENRSVPADLRTLATQGKKRPKNPTTKLFSAVNIFNLLILFHVVADDKTWTTTPPFQAPEFLPGATCNNTKLVTIRARYYDLGLGIHLKGFYVKFPPQVIIIPKLYGNVSKVGDGQFLCGGHHQNVRLDPEAYISQAEVVRQGRGFRVLSWSC